jgi:hypothetical protein
VWVYLVAHLKAMRNAHKTVGKQKKGGWDSNCFDRNR